MYEDEDENTGINPVNNPVFNPGDMPVNRPVKTPDIYKYKQNRNINNMSDGFLLSSLTALVNRPFSSRDQQTIDGWFDDGLDSLIAIEAVKKAIMQGVDSPLVPTGKVTVSIPMQ